MQKNTKDLAKKKATVEDTISKSKKVIENTTNKIEKKATTSTKKASSSIAEKKVATKKVASSDAKKKTASKKVVSSDAKKKTASKKVASSDTKKKTASKKVTSSDTKKKTASPDTEKINTAKKSSVSVQNTAKKSTTKKTSTSNTSKASSSKVKKVSTAKTTKSAKTKKSAPSKKSTTSRKTKKAEIIEYYDLPYRYNQTVVKILAQTPNTLFVYWDIADADRKNYEEKYGKTFFELTFPVLIVHNKTMNYSFEIEINDFANSWYFNVNDAKCDYEIELGRRSRHYTVTLPNNYMHVASSNKIEAPNNHILFEKNQKTLFFRNVKNNTRISKDVSQFQFIKYIGRIYNIYDIYKEIYKHEELQDLENNPSSTF